MKLLKKTINNQIKYIIHISDIHIRQNQRKDEFESVFNNFFNLIKDYPKNQTIIVNTGDTFHTKIQLQPEGLQLASDFLKQCANTFPTIMIPGNHDCLYNRDRLDSISPLVSSLNHPELYYLKYSELYGYNDILFSLHSIFNPEKFIKFKDIPQIYKNEYRHYISLYHGIIDGMMSDIGYRYTNINVNNKTFDGYHLALCGDIHLHQTIQEYDENNELPTIRFAGSITNQNFSEEAYDCGFTLWDLSNRLYKHINIPNEYGYYTIEVNKGKLTTELTNIPKKARIRINCIESIPSEIKAVVSNIKKITDVEEVSYVRLVNNDDSDDKTVSILNENTTIKLNNIADINYQNELLTNFLKNKLKIEDETIINSILEINKTINNNIEKEAFVKGLKWNIKKFEWSNMYSYGENNIIDFSKMNGKLMGLFSKNMRGKTAALDSICYCLFDKTTRGFKPVDLLNNQKSSFKCKLNFEINNIDYFIERIGNSDRKGNVKVEVKFWKVEDNKDIDLKGEDRRNTNDIIKDYVGTFDDFILTTLSVQSGKNLISFIDMGQSERKDLLSKFIGLNIFDKLLEFANNNIKTTETAIKFYKNEDYDTKLIKFTNELSNLTSVVEEESIDVNNFIIQQTQLNEKILNKNKELINIPGESHIDINQINKNIIYKTTEIDKNKKNQADITIKLNKCQNNIDLLEININELNNKNIKESFNQYEKIKLEYDQYNQTIELKKIDVSNKIKKLDMLKKHEYDPNCKFCMNSIFVKDAINTKKELDKDKIEVTELLNYRNVLKKQVENLLWSEKEYINYVKLTDDLSKQQNDKYQLSYSLQSLQSNLSKIEGELIDLNKKASDYNNKIDSITHNNKIELIINDLNKQLKNITFSINEKNKRISEINGKIQFINTKIEEFNIIIKKIKELEKEYQLYSYYIKSVNRDGLPYSIISEIIPTMEAEINNILNQLVDFSIIIKMDGKNISPYIVKNDKKRLIEMGSGFEKFVITLAIRIALMNISNLPKTQCLLQDEGWGVIDSDNFELVKGIFSYLKTLFDVIIIISHMESLHDMVDEQIEIKFEDDFSKIEFI